MEKTKTVILVLLVALSLLQSYFLAYKLPNFGLNKKAEVEYVHSELLGQAKSIDELVFPSQLILHLGNDEHTIIYPKTQFYDLIVSQRLANREFKGFQSVSQQTMNWEQLKREHKGIELNFFEGISVELLKRLLKIDVEGKSEASINRVFIYAVDATEEVKAYFFDDKQKQVYESIDVDLTVKDMQDYIGFGQFLPRYTYVKENLYLADEAIQSFNISYNYDMFSPEEMQRSLFFDSSATRAFVNRSGSQIYTDGKRGLQVEQNGMWIVYTNSTASQATQQDEVENIYAAVDFVNQHGGWDTSYQFVANVEDAHKSEISFRKYILHYPIVDQTTFKYGQMTLHMQQGVVMEYERTMIKLPAIAEDKSIKWLHGGEKLRSYYEAHSLKDSIISIFPALEPQLIGRDIITFKAVWAAKLKDGSTIVFMSSMDEGTTIQPEQ